MPDERDLQSENCEVEAHGTTDRELGMRRAITRRDFLNGVAIAAGTSALPAPLLAAATAAAGDPEKSPTYYPPALSGLRGSHVGSFEVMHGMRDGSAWDKAGKPHDTGEEYDLVVVGGGISGLSAAYYFQRKVGAKARILVLDNHDDFGGHAKRNEFHAGNRKLLGFGGTFSIESPSPYSAVAKAMIDDLGIKVDTFPQYIHHDIYKSRGMSPHVFFDKETFGSDRLVINPAPMGGAETGVEAADDTAWKKFLAEAPLSDKAKQDIVALHQSNRDYLPGLSSDEKKARMARISMAKFLTEVIGASEEVVKFYQASPHPLFGAGIDVVSAQDAWGLGFPGFDGMNLDPAPGPGMNRDAIRSDEAEKYFFHFPDGNATIARLLVRKLIPEAIPGISSKDVVTARANYARLDRSNSTVRIRLNSSVVNVKHEGDPATAKSMEVAYVRRGKLHTVRAKNCVLACWHVVAPYICTELPEKQKAALASAAKVPLLYTNVLLRNWKAFQKLGVNSVYAPGAYHAHMNLDLPVSIGEYKCSQSPDEPIVMHMSKSACKPGLPIRDQHRIGRMQLYGTSFETMERNIRQDMNRMFGHGGFDAARDITAITVNRWPHGYAYQYNSLFDKFWLEGGEQPCVVARQPFGRIAIANSDAAAYAYTDAAIDEAYRAVQELLKLG